MFLSTFGHLSKPLPAKSGPFCKSRQLPVGKVHLQVASSRSHWGRCLGNGSVNFGGGLGKPPLEPHQPLVSKAQVKSTSQMSHGSPLLGWVQLVVPTSKTALQFNSHCIGGGQAGVVQKLPGKNDATYKMAPTLSDFVGKILERKQIPPEGQSHYLKSISSNARYCHAFRLLWTVGFKSGLMHDVENLTIAEMATAILMLDSLSSTEARMAYSACLKVPGFESLRFSPLLAQKKRLWNKSQPKYSTFWEAEKVLDKLKKSPLDWKSVKKVRNRLILMFRLLD